MGHDPQVMGVGVTGANLVPFISFFLQILFPTTLGVIFSNYRSDHPTLPYHPRLKKISVPSDYRAHAHISGLASKAWNPLAPTTFFSVPSNMYAVAKPLTSFSKPSCACEASVLLCMWFLLPGIPFPTVLISFGCCNRSPQTPWLKITGIYYLNCPGGWKFEAGLFWAIVEASARLCSLCRLKGRTCFMPFLAFRGSYVPWLVVPSSIFKANNDPPAFLMWHHSNYYFQHRLFLTRILLASSD